VRFVRLLVWLVTAFFVGMMFYPLLVQMIARLAVDPEFLH
jgi:hypothetical protein